MTHTQLVLLLGVLFGSCNYILSEESFDITPQSVQTESAEAMETMAPTEATTEPTPPPAANAPSECPCTLKKPTAAPVTEEEPISTVEKTEPEEAVATFSDEALNMPMEEPTVEESIDMD